jgi:predicted dehydrogenase
VGVIGCGYWGPRVVRNLHALEDAEVRCVYDTVPDRVEAMCRTYPTIRPAADAREIFDDPEIEAVAICTPIRAHAPLAMAALGAGKHVLVEKPLADSVRNAEALIALAETRGLVLQVDHTFVYSGAVRAIRQMLDRGELGDLLYVDFVRVNLGLFQEDMNVVWDLAPHDLSILEYWADREPAWIQAVGTRHYGKHEEQAYVTIKYDDSFLAHLHLNWLAPVKVRSTLIGGSRRMILYDDLAPSEPVRVYDKGVTLSADPASRARALVDYRVGDVLLPHIEKTEPLAEVCRAFVTAALGGAPPPTDGRSGLAVVRLLEAAQESMRKEGARVNLGRRA